MIRRVAFLHPASVRCDRRAPRGVTLLELLVVLGILSVLLAITLPTLSSVRASAMETSAVAHQREVGSLVRQFGYDNHDEFPFFGVPGTRSALLCLAPDDPVIAGFEVPAPPLCWNVGYWSQPVHWVSHLRFRGYDTGFVSLPPEFERQNNGQPVVFGTVDQLTFGAFAPPKFFRPGDPQLERDHVGQRWVRVDFPSNKVILQRTNFVRRGPSHFSNGEVISWFTDGHAAALNQQDMGPSVPIRLVFPLPGPRGLATRDGLAGRDI